MVAGLWPSLAPRLAAQLAHATIHNNMGAVLIPYEPPKLPHVSVSLLGTAQPPTSPDTIVWLGLSLDLFRATKTYYQFLELFRKDVLVLNIFMDLLSKTLD